MQQCGVRSLAELDANFVWRANWAPAWFARQADFQKRCQAGWRKIFRFSEVAIGCIWCAIPRPKRGASRSSRNAVRDAMDALVQLTNAADADGEGVWSWSPDAGIKPVDFFHGRRWLKSRTPGRARYKS